MKLLNKCVLSAGLKEEEPLSLTIQCSVHKFKGDVGVGQEKSSSHHCGRIWLCENFAFACGDKLPGGRCLTGT